MFADRPAEARRKKGRGHVRPFLISPCFHGLQQPSGPGQLPGGSQPAESIEPNPSPALFQNHHVAVAESAVIGYPHEIKGEGKMPTFLSLKHLSRGYCTAVGSGTVTPTPVSNTVPTLECQWGSQHSHDNLHETPAGLCIRQQQQHHGQKHLQLRLQSMP